MSDEPAYKRVVAIEDEQRLWKKREEMLQLWQAMSDAVGRFKGAQYRWSGDEQKPEELGLEAGMIVRVMPASYKWMNKQCRWAVLVLHPMANTYPLPKVHAERQYEGVWRQTTTKWGRYEPVMMRLGQKDGKEIGQLHQYTWHICEAFAPEHPTVKRLAAKHKAWRVSKRLGAQDK